MHNPSILFVVECFIKINQLIFKENNKWQVENQVTSFLMNPLDSTDWREIHNDGTLKYRFELIEQNNDTVTLFDSSRNALIELSKSTSKFKATGDLDWNTLYYGTWIYEEQEKG